MNLSKHILSAAVLAGMTFGGYSVAMACGDKGTYAYKSGDIVDTASATGSFQTLLTAAAAAGLVDTLKGEGPLTVFAPNDEAFAKLPEGTVEALLNDKEKLRAVLTYHVVAGKVMARDAMKLDSAKTVQGQSLRIRKGDRGLQVDNATVVEADIRASNGVIHVIDQVMLPPRS